MIREINNHRAVRGGRGVDHPLQLADLLILQRQQVKIASDNLPSLGRVGQVRRDRRVGRVVTQFIGKIGDAIGKRRAGVRFVNVPDPRLVGDVKITVRKERLGGQTVFPDVVRRVGEVGGRLEIKISLGGPSYKLTGVT